MIVPFLFSSAIVAQNPKVYVDMSPVWMTYESKGVSSDFQPTGFKWTAGYEVKDFSFASVALEGSAILGVNNDKKSSVTNSGGTTFTNAKVTVDKLYANYMQYFNNLNTIEVGVGFRF
jgi:hypothetical protein